jgi:hypothetical protein
MVRVALPFFNEVADKQMEILCGPPVVLGLVVRAFMLFHGIDRRVVIPLSIFRPFKPVKVLKGRDLQGRAAGRSRQGRPLSSCNSPFRSR